MPYSLFRNWIRRNKSPSITYKNDVVNVNGIDAREKG